MVYVSLEKTFCMIVQDKSLYRRAVNIFKAQSALAASNASQFAAYQSTKKGFYLNTLLL
jgi:hypothetical protein